MSRLAISSRRWLIVISVLAMTMIFYDIDQRVARMASLFSLSRGSDSCRGSILDPIIVSVSTKMTDDLCR
jgi:hypothetical protein